MFYKQDTQETLFHFNENNEFTHSSVMTIRKHTSLPAKCTLQEVPEYTPLNERCYFINDVWVKTELFIGRSFWDEKGNQDMISTFPQMLPDSFSLIEPPKPKKGFALRLINEHWKQIEDHRGKLIYSCANCSQLEEVEHVGPIKEGFTLDEPTTIHDEWLDGAWVTNLNKQYIDEFNQIDDTRRQLYSTICDPLMAEAHIKRALGFQSEASDYEAQAFAARERIQKENPWPKPIS